ncbi:hypothetical protein [Spiroplasma melliferum]|uniref:Alp898 n=1 Tax=Spiroplasma melliferum TaxID=2134 RepID=A0A2L0ARU3_SPIME|nr:hypothetical protein [Spiroplasma melliferum]AUW64503.1 Alp898 [Spiroplasma melliferum]
MKKIYTFCIIASSIFAQNLAFSQVTNYYSRNIPFSFNEKQYIQTRIEGLGNISRNAIKISNNNIVYFGTSQGIYFLPNDATKVKKINGIDDNVIALTVDKENNIYYATEDYQAYIYYNNGSIVKIEGLNDELDDNHITALALDSNDTLYLGTFAAIYYLLSGSTRVEKFNVNDEEGTNNKLDGKVFALVIDHNDNLYFTTNEAKFFSIQNLKIPILVDEHQLNELIYAFAVDQENNIYFGNHVYSSIKKELRNDVGLLDKTTLSIAIDTNNNVYYSTVLAGMYFLKNRTKQLEKTNVFGTSVHAITIDQNDNIFINNNEGPFIFQVYEAPVVPPIGKQKDTLAIEVLGYVFLSSSGAVGLSCLGTWLWNKYRYKKIGRN